jgi:hypothetical protein
MEGQHTIDSIAKDLRQIKEDVRTIRLGLYGDKDNRIPGLIDRQDDDEKKFLEVERRLEVVERKQYKTFVWGGGLVVAVQMIWNLIKGWMNN